MNFTQHLRESLQQSRQALDEWAANEKKAADQMAKAAKDKIRTEQNLIDESSTKLLALQLESGCKIDKENGGSISDGANNAAAKRLQLEQQVAQVQRKKEQLEASLAAKKKHIEGANRSTNSSFDDLTMCPYSILHDFFSTHRPQGRAQTPQGTRC